MHMKKKGAAVKKKEDVHKMAESNKAFCTLQVVKYYG